MFGRSRRTSATLYRESGRVTRQRVRKLHSPRRRINHMDGKYERDESQRVLGNFSNSDVCWRRCELSNIFSCIIQRTKALLLQNEYKKRSYVISWERILGRHVGGKDKGKTLRKFSGRPFVLGVLDSCMWGGWVGGGTAVVVCWVIVVCVGYVVCPTGFHRPRLTPRA